MAETVKCDAFADIYKSLEYCTGKMSMPGTRPRAVFIPKKHVTGWPTLPMANATEMGKVAVYDGNFKLEADKYFHFLDLQLEHQEYLQLLLLVHLNLNYLKL